MLTKEVVFVQIMGSVTNYIKGLSLKTKAQMKLQNPFGVPGATSTDENAKVLEQQSVSQRIASITARLKAGKRLSGADMEFLRTKAPALYEKAVKIAKEREEYRKKLQRCRSKEEVQRLQTEKLQALGSEARAVSQSNMSKGDKTAAFEFIEMRMAGVMNEHQEFTGTPEYKRLPDRDDEAKERRDQNDVNKNRREDELLDLLKKKNEEPVDLRELIGADKENAPQEKPPADSKETQKQGEQGETGEAPKVTFEAKAPKAPTPQHTNRAVTAYRQTLETKPQK